MKSNVPVAEAARDEAVLPERVQEALGSGRASEGGAARAERRRRPGVLTELMEEGVDDAVGPKGQQRGPSRGQA